MLELPNGGDTPTRLVPFHAGDQLEWTLLEA
jgi:hypothetical protein